MDNIEPTTSLPDAEPAGIDSDVERQADVRWTLRSYGNYLFAFAAGSLAVAYGFAQLGPKFGAALVTPIWVVFLLMVSIFAARQQSVVPGLLRLHGLTLLGWAAIWMAALFISIPLDQAWWWWVVAGIAMAVPPLLTRLVFVPRLAKRLAQPRGSRS